MVLNKDYGVEIEETDMKPEKIINEFTRIQSPIKGKTPDNIDLLADITGVGINNNAHFGVALPLLTT